MKDAIQGIFILAAIVCFWLLIFWDDLHKNQAPESIPHYFSFTVIDIQGDTIPGETWCPSSTRDLQIKSIGGAPCLVAVGKRGANDVVMCEVKKLLRFTRFRNLNETR